MWLWANYLLHSDSGAYLQDGEKMRELGQHMTICKQLICDSYCHYHYYYHYYLMGWQ